MSILGKVIEFYLILGMPLESLWHLVTGLVVYEFLVAKVDLSIFPWFLLKDDFFLICVSGRVVEFWLTVSIPLALTLIFLFMSSG